MLIKMSNSGIREMMPPNFATLAFMNKTKLRVVCRRQKRKQQDRWFIRGKNNRIKNHDVPVISNTGLS